MSLGIWVLKIVHVNWNSGVHVIPFPFRSGGAQWLSLKNPFLP